MDREKIVSQARSLPVTELGKVPKDHEIWEAEEGGVKLMLTKNPLPTPENREIFTLSMSGFSSGILSLAEQFANVFGEPQSVHIDQYGTVFLGWLASEVEQRIARQ